MIADAPGHFVSIIIPCFNGQATLAETIESVIGQSHTQWECIIVDDGSTDQSGLIADYYCNKDARIRRVEKTNGGVASARNLGLDMARGDFLAFLDADDIWHPDFLKRHAETLCSAEPVPGFSYCHLRIIDAHSRVFQTLPGHALTGRIAGSLIYFNFVGNPGCAVYSKAALKAAGGYDERLRAQGIEGAEDYLLHLQVAGLFPVIAIPEYLVGYRQTGMSMSANLRRMMDSSDQAVALFLAQCPDLKVPANILHRRRGAFSLRRAVVAFAEGRFKDMIVLACQALRQDPVRNCLMVVVVLQATLRRAVGREKKPVRFGDHDPHAIGFDQSFSRSLVHRVIDRRLKAMARPGTGNHPS